MEFEVQPKPDSEPIKPKIPVRPEWVPVDSWTIMSEATQKLMVGEAEAKEIFFQDQKKEPFVSWADPSTGRGDTMEGGKPVLI